MPERIDTYIDLQIKISIVFNDMYNYEYKSS